MGATKMTTRHRVLSAFLTLVVAGLMGVLGAFLLKGSQLAFLPYPEVVVSSWITWLILTPLARKDSMANALVAGILSPLVGAVVLAAVVALWSARSPFQAVYGLILIPGLLLVGLKFLITTGWVIFPVGMFTGVLIRLSQAGLPPPERTSLEVVSQWVEKQHKKLE